MSVVSSEATTAVALSSNVISPANGEGGVTASSSNAISTVIRDPGNSLGKRFSRIDSTQNAAPPVCWLLQANHEHPNLNPLEEEDWKSLLATAEAELRHE